jgi:hypothetical protein
MHSATVGCDLVLGVDSAPVLKQALSSNGLGLRTSSSDGSARCRSGFSTGFAQTERVEWRQSKRQMDRA